MSDHYSPERLFFLTRKIGMNLSEQLDAALKTDCITGIQVYFLVYILRHHPEGTYLTELCRETGMSKATLSALVKKMREKQYLYFLENPDDVRRKKILPTDKLIREGDLFLNKADEMENKVCSVLEQSEQEQLWELEKKLICGFEKQNKNQKQEGCYREKSITAAGSV